MGEGVHGIFSSTVRSRTPLYFTTQTESCADFPKRQIEHLPRTPRYHRVKDNLIVFCFSPKASGWSSCENSELLLVFFSCFFYN